MVPKSKHLLIGQVGENVATRFLVKQGFCILERNYRQKWGEIDIIAEKSKKLHFVEVKSISREKLSTAIRETGYRPEDNVHFRKRKRLGRAIETYLLEKYKRTDVEWVFNVVTVYVSLKNKNTKVNFIKNIVL